jgi:hypothetical protein
MKYPVARGPGDAGFRAGVRRQDRRSTYPRGAGALREPDPGDHAVVSGLASRRTESRLNHQNPGASGSVNRLLRPASLRHVSVTTAAQRRLLTDDDAG